MSTSTLTFDNFSYLNARRCVEGFGRKLNFDSAVVHTLAACGEVGEMAQEIKRILDTGSEPTEEQVEKLMNEVADAITYLDLIPSHLGQKTSDILTRKFNVVSDRIGTKIKIPV